MRVVVLDKDVASSLLRRRAPDAVTARLAGHVAAVSFVTVGELTKWTLVRHGGPRNVAAMRDFLSQLLVLPYDQQVAARWGELQAARSTAAGQRQLIAACRLVRDLPLATFNAKDYEDFAEHDGLTLALR